MKTFQKAVTFSYDDGISQDKKLVELMNKYGMKATFNLNTGIQSPDSNFTIENVYIHRMEQEGLPELYKGHEIAVHGLTHAAPEKMTKEEMDVELLQDAKNIEKIYGTYPVGMAYAYGAYDDASIAYLKDMGIQYGRTVCSTHSFKVPENPILLEATCHHNDEELFNLAKKFVEETPAPGEQWLFYVWGHSYEFDVDKSWDRIEKLFQMLSGKEDIFYGTNTQCLRLFHAIPEK